MEQDQTSRLRLPPPPFGAQVDYLRSPEEGCRRKPQGMAELIAITITEYSQKDLRFDVVIDRWSGITLFTVLLRQDYSLRLWRPCRQRVKIFLNDQLLYGLVVTATPSAIWGI